MVVSASTSYRLFEDTQEVSSETAKAQTKSSSEHTHNMSSRDRSIRIIKRADRESLLDRETPLAPVKTESQIKRELLKTIESWIKEQRETRKSFIKIRSFENA